MAPLASCMDDISVVHKTRKRVHPRRTGLQLRRHLDQGKACPGDCLKGKKNSWGSFGFGLLADMGRFGG
jgi:hypothetical protein